VLPHAACLITLHTQHVHSHTHTHTHTHTHRRGYTLCICILYAHIIHILIIPLQESVTQEYTAVHTHFALCVFVQHNIVCTHCYFVHIHLLFSSLSFRKRYISHLISPPFPFLRYALLSDLCHSLMCTFLFLKLIYLYE